jgi:hypothetical protein
MKETPSNTDYDVIIVGAGAAGLYTALCLLRARPKLRLAIFERQQDIGGRAFTFRQTIEKGVKLQWEAGAGRISTAHHRLHTLIRRYKLHVLPIGGDVNYIHTYGSQPEPNAFEPAIPAMIDTLAGLPQGDLAANTIRQLLTRIHGATKAEEFLIRFPYRAEVDIMRADMALELFRGEMRKHEGYGICQEGLGAVMAGMEAEIRRRGGNLFTHHELTALLQNSAKDDVYATFRTGSPKEGVARPEGLVRARHCVLALPHGALCRLPALEQWRGLKHLRMAPLLRMYGVFPRSGGHVWYEGQPGRVVTSEPVRYFIGGNAAIGSAQISYTDSQDALHWMKRLAEKGEKATGLEIVDQLRRLITPDIPSPIFIKAHPWPEGTTYWLPGRYDPAEVSREAWQPLPDTLPGVHICGESLSLRQGWIEGALEHAEGLCKWLLRGKRLER